MTNLSDLSEEELLEQEIWRDGHGNHYTIEEMDDSLLKWAIECIEGLSTWRRDWLPTLLCERERREELRNQAQDAKDELHLSRELLRDLIQTAYAQTPVTIELTAKQFEVLCARAAALSESDLPANAPKLQITLSVTVGVSDNIPRLNRLREDAKKERLYRVLELEAYREADVQGVGEEPPAYPPQKRDFSVFEQTAQAMKELPSYKKFLKDRFRK